MRLPFINTERVLQVLSLALMVFLAIYLIVFVQSAREQVECQTRVNDALITSVSASRDAGSIERGAQGIERDAMRTLLHELLDTPHPNSRDALATYQQRLEDADVQLRAAGQIRIDNPLPQPSCG